MLSFPKCATIALLGGGVSHRPLLSLLPAWGYRVSLYDTKDASDFTDLWQTYPQVDFHFGKHALDSVQESILFRSPGIRPDRFGILTAQAQGAVLTSETEQFLLHAPCPVIGVTGSSGKTTTASLIHALLSCAGRTSFLGGNIGVPLLASLPALTKDHLAVAELSSFQLMDLRVSPRVAVLTNLSENHLDYHTDMEEYLFAKAGIFLHSPCKQVILNFDDPYTKRFSALVPKGAEIRYFGFGNKDSLFVSCHDGYLWKEKEPWVAVEELRLPGQHNLQNFMAAITACAEEIDRETARQVAREFSGVPHRLQPIPTHNGIRCYNSSIDTTPARTLVTLQALAADAGKIHLILGGYDKKLSFAPLIPSLSSFAKSITLTGATAPKIRTALQEANCTLPTFHICDFDTAVKQAYRAASPGDIVLLSPACASYDAFPNYEKRGQRFCEIIASLNNEKGGVDSL